MVPALNYDENVSTTRASVAGTFGRRRRARRDHLRLVGSALNPYPQRKSEESSADLDLADFSFLAETRTRGDRQKTSHLRLVVTSANPHQQRESDDSSAELAMDGIHLSLDPKREFDYSYTGGNPINFVDPRGTKVYLAERPIDHRANRALGNPAGHLYLIVVPDHPEELLAMKGFDIKGILGIQDLTSFTLSAFDAGVLKKDVNNDTDYAATPRFKQEIKPPVELCSVPGLSSDTKFIFALVSAFGKYKDNQKYDTFAGSNMYLPPLHRMFESNSFNSNSFIAGLLQSAGVDGSAIPNPPGVQTGLDKPVPIK